MLDDSVLAEKERMETLPQLIGNRAFRMRLNGEKADPRFSEDEEDLIVAETRREIIKLLQPIHFLLSEDPDMWSHIQALAENAERKVVPLASEVYRERISGYVEISRPPS